MEFNQMLWLPQIMQHWQEANKQKRIENLIELYKLETNIKIHERLHKELGL